MHACALTCTNPHKKNNRTTHSRSLASRVCISAGKLKHLNQLCWSRRFFLYMKNQMFGRLPSGEEGGGRREGKLHRTEVVNSEHAKSALTQWEKTNLLAPVYARMLNHLNTSENHPPPPFYFLNTLLLKILRTTCSPSGYLISTAHMCVHRAASLFRAEVSVEFVLMSRNRKTASWAISSSAVLEVWLTNHPLPALSVCFTHAGLNWAKLLVWTGCPKFRQY